MQKSQSDSNHYRYERKFFISELTRQEVESIVKFQPAMFTEIFHERFVNNIYFDSADFKNYYDNVEGSTHRKKIRIRWYGELTGFIDKPVLELKIKNSFLGRKESYLLQPFKLDDDFNIQKISTIIRESDIPEIIRLELKFLEPVLINRYRRKYFQSVDKAYRVTVDSDLIYYGIHHQYISFLNKLVDDINIILELKYDQKLDNNSDYITSRFPFRLTKISKYVAGIDKSYTWQL